MEIKIYYEDLKEEEESIGINDLCMGCQLFRSNTNLNNGYGCLEMREEVKDYPGKCYPFDCPIARPDEEDDDGDLVIPFRRVVKIV